MNHDQIVRARSGIEARATADGAILVDMNTGKCFRLNRVGAELWSLLDRPRGIDALCALLIDRHQRALADAERDVAALLAQLRSAKLIDDAGP
jgi:hypothetical protein